MLCSILSAFRIGSEVTTQDHARVDPLKEQGVATAKFAWGSWNIGFSNRDIERNGDTRLAPHSRPRGQFSGMMRAS